MTLRPAGLRKDANGFHVGPVPMREWTARQVATEKHTVDNSKLGKDYTADIAKRFIEWGEADKAAHEAEKEAEAEKASV